MNAPLMELCDIQTRIGGVHELAGVDFDLAAGKVHVLLGENGAGQSTLTGVLSGAVPPDAGSMSLDGHPASIANPREADAAGIVMIPQVPGLDIAGNLFCGNEIVGNGLPAAAEMRRRAQDLLARAGVSLHASLSVANPRMGKRQLVAIAKALSAKARILLMDEPDAALSAVEADHLFTIVKKLFGRGVGIVYI
ncbi:ATP-binding cassette domain-containing protein, partial [Caballeronia terrestris]|uniref:ATP-binding cassette domain-containing protein n=1 Tax=Caballeronia terrestris TaxID=1226301 RepID=UPI000AF67331